MDVPGIPRPVLVALIAVAVLLFAYGGTKATALITEHTDTQTRVLPGAPTIVVDVETGDVRVTATDRRDVRLTTKEKRSMWGGGHAEVAGDAHGCTSAITARRCRWSTRPAASATCSRCRATPMCAWPPAPATCTPRTSTAASTCTRAPATCTPSASAAPCACRPTPATSTSKDRRPRSPCGPPPATSTSWRATRPPSRPRRTPATSTTSSRARAMRSTRGPTPATRRSTCSATTCCRAGWWRTPRPAT